MTISKNVESAEIPVIPEGEEKKSPGFLSRITAKLGNLPVVVPLVRKAGGVKNLNQLKVLTKPVFIVPAFLIIYVGFGMAYQSKQSEYDDLQPQIAAQKTALSVPVSTAKLESLQVQLTEAQAEFDKMQNSQMALSLPTPGQNIDIYDEIVDLGEAASLSSGQPVQIINIKASSPMQAKGKQDTQDALAYTVTVDGSTPALLDFVSRLITSQELLQSMAITRISIADKEDFQTLTLDFSILTQPKSASGDTHTP